MGIRFHKNQWTYVFRDPAIKVESNYVIELMELLESSEGDRRLADESFSSKKLYNCIVRDISKKIPHLKEKDETLIRDITELRIIIAYKNRHQEDKTSEEKKINNLQSVVNLRGEIREFCENIQKTFLDRSIQKKSIYRLKRLNVISEIDSLIDNYIIFEKNNIHAFDNFIQEELPNLIDESVLKENGLSKNSLRKIRWCISRYLFLDESQQKCSNNLVHLDKSLRNLEGLLGTALQIEVDEFRYGKRGKLFLLCQYLDWSVDLKLEIISEKIKNFFLTTSMTEFELLDSYPELGKKFNTKPKEHKAVVLNYLESLSKEEGECVYDIFCEFMRKYFEDEGRKFETGDLKRRLNYKKMRSYADDGKIFNLWACCDFLISNPVATIDKVLRIALFMDSQTVDEIPKTIAIFGQAYDVLSYDNYWKRFLDKIGVESVIKDFDKILAFKGHYIPQATEVEGEYLIEKAKNFNYNPSLDNELKLISSLPRAFFYFFNEISLENIHNL